MTPEFSIWLDEKEIPESRHQSLWEACEKMHKALCLLDKENLRIICDTIGIENLINNYAVMEQVCHINFSPPPSVTDENGAVKNLLDYIYKLEEQGDLGMMSTASSTVLYDKVSAVQGSMRESKKRRAKSET